MAASAARSSVRIASAVVRASVWMADALASREATAASCASSCPSISARSPAAAPSSSAVVAKQGGVEASTRSASCSPMSLCASGDGWTPSGSASALFSRLTGESCSMSTNCTP